MTVQDLIDVANPLYIRIFERNPVDASAKYIKLTDCKTKNLVNYRDCEVDILLSFSQCIAGTVLDVVIDRTYPTGGF